MIKKIIVFAAIFINVVPVLSQSPVFTNDTTIQRKTEYRIPVYADFDKPAEKIYFEIDYDNFTINLFDFQLCDSCLFDNVDFTISVTPDHQNGSLSINGELKQSTQKGILGYAVIEGLYGPDSLSKFDIKSLDVDEEPIDPKYYDKTQITILGESIYPSEREEISYNFPNPFYYSTSFDILLTESTKLKFSIYEFSGRRLAEFPGEATFALDYRLFNENSNTYFDIKDNLPPGDYKFTLIPDNSVFATGTYYMIIESNTNIYKRNILHQK